MRAAVALVVLTVASCKSKSESPAPVTTGSGSGTESGSMGSAATATPAPSSELLLPEVSGQGYEQGAMAPDLRVTTQAVLLGDNAVATIVDGAASSAETGGGTRAEIEPLVRALAARPLPARVTLALDKRLTFRGLYQTVVSVVTATHVRDVAVLARRGADTLVLPLTLLDSGTEPAKATGPTEVASIEVGKATASPETSLGGDAVGMKLTNAYIPLIKTCLQTGGPRVDGPLHETVELGFTIDDTGHTVDTSAYGTGASASDCLASAMKNWMFPAPKDHELVPTNMTVKILVEVAYKPVAGTTPAPPAPVAADVEPPLGLRVTITPTEVVVWSSSGREGTLRDSKVRVPLGDTTARDLEHALVEIVRRRWSTAQRSETDKSITFAVDASVRLQVVAELLGVVRRAADGTELFPRVQVSAAL